MVLREEHLDPVVFFVPQIIMFFKIQKKNLIYFDVILHFVMGMDSTWTRVTDLLCYSLLQVVWRLEGNSQSTCVYFGLQKQNSCSSVPKSTSSMTLPVSSPSSHSQFEYIAQPEGATQVVLDDQGFPLPPMPLPPHPPRSPQDIEKRLDELSRWELFCFLLVLLVFSCCKFTAASLQLQIYSCKLRAVCRLL